MARNKNLPKKLRLGKQGKRTKWAPFWVIPKAKGKGKRVHPSTLTRVKRTWRRTQIKNRIKQTRPRRQFRGGTIKRKY
jgi:ribosomal protein L39E